MAALREIAAAYADEIREGIAWVIIWKTGRSWHAEAIWLNPETEKVKPEDWPKVDEILKQDPAAVMVNGYYCGHFGEGMTVKEIEAGIRWHYENGIRLKDSDVMEPEQESEEPQEHPELPGRRIPQQAQAAEKARRSTESIDRTICGPLLKCLKEKSHSIDIKRPGEYQNSGREPPG